MMSTCCCILRSRTGCPQKPTRHLELLGYALQAPTRRNAPAYRFMRGDDVIDVMAADHAAPSRREQLRSARMFEVGGGTQVFSEP